MTLAIGMFSFGVLIGQFNPVSIVFKYLQGWDDHTNTLNVAVVTTTGNFGAMVGAFIAPTLMNKGKRKVMILLNIVLIVAYALQTFLPISLTVCIIGKLIQGIASGAFSTICPSYINEMTPTELMGPIGGLNQAGVTFGILLPSLMAWSIPAGITVENPSPEYMDEFLVKSYWRVINFTPAIFSLLQIILQLTVFN